VFVAKVPCVHGAFGLGQAPKKNLQAYISAHRILKYPESENLWLASLRNDLKAENINAIMENRKRQMQDSGIDAYIDVVYEANRKTAEENDMSWLDSVAELMERKGLNSEWIEKGRDEGLEQGLTQGREQAMTAIARNLLAKGSTPEFVSDITGLSLEEIEKL
jgi:predicted transposase/invertase (TIGR01784 family)